MPEPCCAAHSTNPLICLEIPASVRGLKVKHQRCQRQRTGNMPVSWHPQNLVGANASRRKKVKRLQGMT